MKTRESGMPSDELWQTFFKPAETLRALGLHQEMAHVVELGCGFGTFTVPAGLMTTGNVHAFDIEQSMIEETRRKAQAAGCENIKLYLRDFVAHGTGLPDSHAMYVMLFNILHAENPDQLLQESFRVLETNGLLAIMHWNYDSQTPRGPSMNIRPKPGECAHWAEIAGFEILAAHMDLPPYHYGVIAKK